MVLIFSYCIFSSFFEILEHKMVLIFSYCIFLSFFEKQEQFQKIKKNCKRISFLKNRTDYKSCQNKYKI